MSLLGFVAVQQRQFDSKSLAAVSAIWTISMAHRTTRKTNVVLKAATAGRTKWRTGARGVRWVTAEHGNS
ncbi:hypothetical protein MRB53_038447 [Persea americana]|nr:hypothetical protein MRB53_038447 [Persea americana]